MDEVRMTLPGLLSSVPGVDSDDWYTPPYIFEGLRLKFDLDVAAPQGGVPWIPATRYFTEQDDGLAQLWEGRVWLNPPYSKPGPWLARLWEHGNGIALVPADTASKWWHTATRAPLVCFLRDRVMFVRAGNTNVSSARFPSALVVWGWECVDAVIESDLGWCVRSVS